MIQELLVIILPRQKQLQKVEMVFVIIALFQALLNFKYLRQHPQVLTIQLIQQCNITCQDMQADTAQSLVQNEIYGNGNTVMTATILAIEFRPNYEVEGFTGSKYVFWYDYAVIK
jgi:hypothetical protein